MLLLCKNGKKFSKFSHFSEDNKRVDKNGSYRLKDGAIPKVVENCEKISSKNENKNSTPEIVPKINHCDSCSKLKEDNESLHKQIIKLTLDHQIKIMHFEKQLEKFKIEDKLTKQKEIELKRNLSKLKKDEEKISRFCEADNLKVIIFPIGP